MGGHGTQPTPEGETPSRSGAPRRAADAAALRAAACREAGLDDGECRATAAAMAAFRGVEARDPGLAARIRRDVLLGRIGQRRVQAIAAVLDSCGAPTADDVAPQGPRGGADASRRATRTGTGALGTLVADVVDGIGGDAVAILEAALAVARERAASRRRS